MVRDCSVRVEVRSDSKTPSITKTFLFSDKTVKFVKQKNNLNRILGTAGDRRNAWGSGIVWALRFHTAEKISKHLIILKTFGKPEVLTTVFFYITYSPIFIEETNGTIRFDSKP